MEKITHLDLFSGIGGFALAAEAIWPEIRHVFVDNDPFCQAILKKHWPKAIIHGDIRTFAYPASAGLLRTEQLEDSSSSEQRRSADDTKPKNPIYERPLLLTGGFPCQPFSHAGRRKGTADDRYLWPQMFAVIEHTLPRWVVAENVRGLATWNDGMVLEKCCADLEGIGYEVQPIVIPACAVGAPHRRDRIWIIAHNTGEQDNRERRDHEFGWNRMGREEKTSQQEDGEANHDGLGGQNSPAPDAGSKKSGGLSGGKRKTVSSSWKTNWEENWPSVAARLCRMDDGLSDGVARPRGWRNAALKAYGNAIAPAVAVEIFRAIKYSLSG